MRHVRWLVLLMAALLAMAAGAQVPEIGYVTEPVVHWSPFFVFGDDWGQGQVDLLTWAAPEVKELQPVLERLVRDGLPTPPQTPPQEALVGLYGRTRRLGPQVLGCVQQYGVNVMWLRTKAGLSQPYVVNRPELFFVEFSPVAPGQEVRVFGRKLNTNQWQPAPKLWLVGKQDRQLHPVTWGVRFDHQNHLAYQLQYELRWLVPTDLPAGEYELWLHNGSGGEWGFGKPLPVTVARPAARPAQRFDVKQQGAVGDGVTDDIAALEKAVQAAAKAGGGVVYFPTGKYLLSRPLRVLPGVDLQGADRDWVKLVATEDFKGAFPKDPLPGKAEDWGPHFREQQTAPMVYLVSRSKVSELSFAGSQGTHWLILMMNPAGPVRSCTVTRCTLTNPCAPFLAGKWRDTGSCVAVIGGSDEVEVSYCALTGMGGMGGYGGPTRHGRFLFNTYQPLTGPYGTNGMGWIIGDQCVIEGNVCSYANRGFTCGLWFGPIRQNFIARNMVLNSGWVEGAGESFLFEAPDIGRENWVGNPSAVGPDFLEQTDQKWPAGVLVGRVALICAGRGFGQWRLVKENTENRVTLTEPWRTVPDQTSWITVRPFFMQNLLVNNHCRDTLGGIDFYGGALENVVERFVGTRSRGVWFYGGNIGDPKERMVYGPDAFNLVVNCQFSDASGGVIFQSNRLLEMIQPQPILFGNVVRGNQFYRCGIAASDGVLLSLTNTSWLPADDPRRKDLPPSSAWNAFGGNQFDLLVDQKAFRFDPWTTGSLFWLNGPLPDARPLLLDDRGTGTTEIPR